MYSRFQTLVSGLQILKKSYVASDYVSKILRSLPARWIPKVTAIEEAKDLNTLSVEYLVSSLKVHEISLNEHEPAKKSKSIALPSKGKSSKALKVIKSEEESPDGDSDEDPAKMMAMLSNRLQYLAKKNKKFLSKRSGYKGSGKEDHAPPQCMILFDVNFGEIGYVLKKIYENMNPLSAKGFTFQFSHLNHTSLIFNMTMTLNLTIIKFLSSVDLNSIIILSSPNFSGGGQGLNLRPYIYCALSLPIELNLPELFFFLTKTYKNIVISNLILY